MEQSVHCIAVPAGSKNTPPDKVQFIDNCVRFLYLNSTENFLKLQLYKYLVNILFLIFSYAWNNKQ